MDALILDLANVSEQLLPILGAVVLIFLCVLLKKAWEMIDSIHETIKNLDPAIKDVEKSIAYIREMFHMLTEPQHMSESVFYCHIYGKENFGRKYDEAMESYAERILPGLLAEIKTDEGYAFLRGNEEFEEVLRTAERFTKK